MTPHASLSGMRVSTLDYLISVMDSPLSPLDFTIILRFNEKLDLDGLRKGALSARNVFPTTGSSLKANRWARGAATSEGIQIADSSGSEDTITNFVNRPIDLGHDLPVQQLVIKSDHENTTTLVTKFHHAASDGMSASLWMNHQLEIALGFEVPQDAPSPFESLPLKHMATFVRRSRFAFNVPSDQLWTLPVQRSGVRNWKSISFASNNIQKACRRARGFTYSDLLATCALQVFGIWNREQRGEHPPRVGLWLPINIRQRSAEGFGNGTSRIRIYANYPQALSLADKCREVRRQIHWCISRGEWVVPKVNHLTTLPRWATAPLLRRHLTRPSIDMGTGVFSHVQRWTNRKESFATLEGLECVGLLHPFQALAINGATHNGNTWLTFTYDAAMYQRQHVQRLIDLYLEQLETAERTLR